MISLLASISILLGICFLHERRPPLILVLAVGEHRAPVLGGYQVIHKDLLPGAEPPEVEFENATETLNCNMQGGTYTFITCISPACHSPTPGPQGRG